MVRQNADRTGTNSTSTAGKRSRFYRLADGVMTFTHTEVPAQLRGRGLGSQMMQAVLRDVRAQGLKVVPRCPFVADYIRRNPGFADLLAQRNRLPREGGGDALRCSARIEK